MNVGILVFDEVELLDMAGPYEVFTTAARVHGRAQPPGAPALFAVSTIGRGAGPVRARAGLRLQPDHTLANHPPLTCAIVPGGVVDAELGHHPPRRGGRLHDDAQPRRRHQPRILLLHRR